MFEKIAELWREAGYGMRLCRKNPDFTLIVFLVIVIGLAVGIGGAYGDRSPYRQSPLRRPAMDPTTIGAVALVLVLVAFLACYIPGRRATKLDPLTALRVE